MGEPGSFAVWIGHTSKERYLMSTTSVPQAFASAFQARQRANGETFVTLAPGAPSWCFDVVRAAHGDMFPDDWRHEMIRRIAETIVDYDGELSDDNISEYADACTDVYTSDLIAWHGSNINRSAYVDDAVAEGLATADMGIIDRLRLGQYLEYCEIAALVLSALREVEASR